MSGTLQLPADEVRELLPGVWFMLDAEDKPVRTPCCQSLGWLEPYLSTSLCSKCGKAHIPSNLGVVRGVR